MYTTPLRGTTAICCAVQHLRRAQRATLVAASIKRAFTVVPGIPPDDSKQELLTTPPPFTNVKLPDIWQPDPEPAVEPPFYPDFWESSRSKAAETTSSAHQEPTLPKLLVITDATTSLGDDPMHSLHPENESTYHRPEPDRQPTTSTGEPGLLQDVVEELGVPTTFSFPPPRSQTSEREEQTTRELKEEERTGLWALLAFVGSVWVVGNIIHRRSRSAKDVLKEVEAPDGH